MGLANLYRPGDEQSAEILEKGYEVTHHRSVLLEAEALDTTPEKRTARSVRKHPERKYGKFNHYGGGRTFGILDRL